MAVTKKLLIGVLPVFGSLPCGAQPQSQAVPGTERFSTTPM